MNLHAVVSGAVGAINPPFTGSVVYSTGSTQNADFTRTPTTRQVNGVSMQVQALTAEEIQHIDSLNLQDIVRGVYLNGNVQGLNRPAAKGGDILLIPTRMTPAAVDTWLVKQVIERWDSDGWCKVAVVLQNPPQDQ